MRIEGVPTVREPDGLARSSRNARLDPAARARAAALPRALEAAGAAAAAGERDGAAITAAARAALAQAGGDAVDLEYVALVAPDTFAPVTTLDGDDALVAIAARVGGVRLIDNRTIRTPEPRP